MRQKITIGLATAVTFYFIYLSIIDFNVFYDFLYGINIVKPDTGRGTLLVAILSCLGNVIHYIFNAIKHE